MKYIYGIYFKTGGENHNKLCFLGMVGAINRSGVIRKYF
jgi:hypothetical protein